MSESFYITLPSHGSRFEFPNNTSNNFKIRLPEPKRLRGSGWKVALASISLPDPKNVLPPWMTGSTALLYTRWFHRFKDDLNNKKLLSATFKVSDVSDVVDLNNMTGVDFMKTATEWLTKQFLEQNLIPGYVTGYTTVDAQKNERTQHDFHSHFKFEGDDLVIDSRGVEFHDFGWTNDWKAPAVTILIELALEMGWFKRRTTPYDPSDARFDLDLGPNLMMELRGNALPTPRDLKFKWDADGSRGQAIITDRYWYIQRNDEGALSKYVKLSLDVNWRFINLNQSFKNVLESSSRSLFVYSDVGGSSVVGDQVTDLLREVNYERGGKGSYYFEPTHLQYIPLRKEVLDTIEVQVAETTGDLVKFGQENTIVTLKFERT